MHKILIILFNFNKKIVMERVIKRYFMHNQGDYDDPKQNEIDELKQEVGIVRHELNNEIKRLKEHSWRNLFKINGWIQIMADELINTNKNINRTNYVSYQRFEDLINQQQQSPCSIGSPAFNSSDDNKTKFRYDSNLIGETFSTNSRDEVYSISRYIANNRSRSTEDFFHNRLNYDFNNIYEE
jgi:hypothetical protein